MQSVTLNQNDSASLAETDGRPVSYVKPPAVDPTRELQNGITKFAEGQSKDFELILDAQLEMGKMQKIPKAWVISGDFDADCGLFIEGKIKGKVVSRGNVVVLARDAEVLGGVICEVLISCGHVGGDVLADQIIVGDDGALLAKNVHVSKGKLLICPGAEFSGNVHSL